MSGLNGQPPTAIRIFLAVRVLVSLVSVMRTSTAFFAVELTHGFDDFYPRGSENKFSVDVVKTCNLL